MCYHKYMKVEWNKVTWYSKLLALAVVVILPFLGFILGMKYGAVVEREKDEQAIHTVDKNITNQPY